jgi:hypothetical protein
MYICTNVRLCGRAFDGFRVVHPNHDGHLWDMRAWDLRAANTLSNLSMFAVGGVRQQSDFAGAEHSNASQFNKEQSKYLFAPPLASLSFSLTPTAPKGDVQIVFGKIISLRLCEPKINVAPRLACVFFSFTPINNS